MSRRVDGARWVADSSLKFRVNGVFVNGKMTVSLPQCGIKASSEWQGYSPICGIRCSTGMCLCHSILRRSILICACELHFNLQTAGSWTPVYGGFDYQGLYDYIVDFFEDTPGPAGKKHAQELLNWWSLWVFPLFINITLNSHRGRKIFPAAALHHQSNISASRKRFKEQLAALEHENAWQ